MKRLNWRDRRISTAVTCLVVVLALSLSVAASATQAVPQEPRPISASGFAPSADDGGAWEVGAEAAGGNLASYACSEATYLRNRLTAYGWVSRFLYCGTSAWEEDFKRAGAPGGGNEHNKLDTVDLMFYVGHGSPSSFTFDSNKDDHNLTPSDCNYSWGDGDNEWVGLTSCQVLADSNRAQWAACMKGTHQILGFITNASARMGTGTQGYNWAYYITNNWTVTGAWFKACDVSQPAGRKVRVLAEELGCYNDKPQSSYVGCSDAWDYDYYYWDHTCGSELPRPVDVASITAMPVYRTPPLSLAEAQAEYTHLGSVFGLPTRPPASASAAPTEVELWSVQQGDRELEMERNSGLFTYYDMNLWSGQSAEAAFAARAASISGDDARAIADAFLRQNNLLPRDAQFYEVTTDVLTAEVVSPTLGAASTIASTDTVYQVIYSRVLPATVVNAAGQPAQQDFLVVGPGAKLKVYVPMTATLASAASPNVLMVSGVQGGWRRVEGPAAATAIEAVPIITQAQARKAYEQVAPFVLLNAPPIDADRSVIISPTLAYWEEGSSHIQSALFPVYGLYVEYFQGTTSLNKDYAYLPASPLYMRPYAQIVSGPTAPVHVGQEVAFTAADASKTLAQLGFDPILDFALGSGDPADYLYEWFADSISDANKLGGGVSTSITFKVRPSAELKDGLYRQTIILRVTDIGSSDLRSSVATYSLDIYPQVTLPIIFRRR